jgi:hypothetical protein
VPPLVNTDGGRRAGGAGAFLELLALTGLAVTQPLLDVFSRAPDAFVARRAGPSDIVAFALLIAFVPPLLLWAAERVVALAGEAPGRGAHLVAVAGLGTALAVQVGRGTGAPRAGLLALALVVGVLLAIAVARAPLARTFLRYLAVAPVAFVALFLLTSPVSRVVLAAGDAAAADVEVARPAPVVMIVLDELPTASLLDGAGAIDAELYPNLAALAGDGTWYRNHTTAAAYTEAAVPSILTGRWPVEAKRPATADEHPENLFTLLGGTYELAVVERFTHLCPPDLCGTSRPAALPGLLREAAGAWSSLAAPREPVAETTDPAVDPLVEADRADRRFDEMIGSLDGMTDHSLHFLHAMLPHQPWNWLPSGQRHAAPHAEGLYGTWVTTDAAEAGRQRHILQTQFADREVGRVMDRLRDLGHYEDALVVVTADHGVSFSPREPIRALGSENAADVLWVPLIVKAPAQTVGEVEDRPTRSVDILPTVADHLSIEIPWDVDGRSARDGRPDPDGPLEVFDWPSDREARGRDPEVDASAVFAEVLQRRAAAEKRAGLLPPRGGPHGALVGVPVAELESGPPAPPRASLDDPGALDEVDVTAPTLPVYVAGHLDTDEPHTVAVAVNGVVGGVFTTTDWDGGQRFWTVVPPDLLVDGRNEVDVHLVEGEPGSERLSPMVVE